MILTDINRNLEIIVNIPNQHRNFVYYQSFFGHARICICICIYIHICISIRVIDINVIIVVVIIVRNRIINQSILPFVLIVLIVRLLITVIVYLSFLYSTSYSFVFPHHPCRHRHILTALWFRRQFRPQEA